MDEVKVYHGFSGADFVISINGEVYGEINKLNYKIENGKKIIKLTFNVFAESKIINLYDVLYDAKVILILANEYGDAYKASFTGVHYIGEEGNNCTDSPNIELTYVCSFEDINRFTPLAKGESVTEILKGDKYV